MRATASSARRRRSRRRVTLVAVTKGFGADAVVEAAVAAGLVDLGENYAQELLAKADAGRRRAAVRWHFLGRLQRNKVRLLAPFVHLWQSVDRRRAGRRRSPSGRPGRAVLVQVNIVAASRRRAAAARPRPGARRRASRDLGLDVARPHGASGRAGDAGGGPARASALLRRWPTSSACAERSMGMTDDLEVAVQEGATMVRVGHARCSVRVPAQRPVRH